MVGVGCRRVAAVTEVEQVGVLLLTELLTSVDDRLQNVLQPNQAPGALLNIHEQSHRNTVRAQPMNIHEKRSNKQQGLY